MDTLLNNLDIFVEGFKNTLILFFSSGAIALVLGTIIGSMRVSPVPAMRAFGTVYVNLVRNTPLTLIMFFFAFGYPKLGFPKADYLVLALIALSLYTATYVAEALRSGVNTVPVGQAEAARAIGLGFVPTLTNVVLPQAFRGAIAPLGNVLIALTKNTTVVATVGVAELSYTMKGMLETNSSLLYTIFFLIAICFVILTLPVGVLFTSLSRRLVVHR